MTRIVVLCFVLLSTLSLFAQDQQPAPAQDEKPVPKYVSPAARLAAAKMVYIKNGGGSELPFNIISGGIEGWPRFVVVQSPQEADIVIEISAPIDESVSITGDEKNDAKKKTDDLNVSNIKVLIYDAKTHLPLWNANERPKGGFKDRTREDNLVKAAENLLAKLHQRFDPPPPEADASKK